MSEVNPKDLENRQVYKLLTGSIVPRAIAWVSTKSTDGILNLAPYSFFTAVTSNPPTVLFCPSATRSDGSDKDTLTNARETGEFVINFVNEALGEAMSQTAVEAPATLDEFERAGLTPQPSTLVDVPRVKESPIAFECKLNQIVDIGTGHIVIGEVVYMHFAEGIHDASSNYIDMKAYQPIGRLTGNLYAHVNELFELIRPPSELSPKS